MRLSSFFGAAAVGITLGAQAASLTVTGDWYRNIGSSDLTTGAGSDFRSAIESSTYQGGVSIASTGGAPWSLLAQRSGDSLPAGVTLEVRRTGSGNCANLSGGMEYLTLGEQPQALFSGTGDCNGIGIQLRLQGVSVQQPPGAYSTTVLYTLQ